MLLCLRLAVCVDDSAAALLPCCEQDAAVAAHVVDILEAVDQIGDTSKAENCAHDKGPDTIFGRQGLALARKKIALG